MGRVQLRRLPELHKRRQRVAALYAELLGDLPELLLPAVRPDVEHGWHLYPVRLRPDRTRLQRDALIVRLKEMGIGTSVHFIPLHLHSYYRETFGYEAADFPVASAAAETILSLPFHTRLTDEDVHAVADALHHALQGSGRP